MSSRRAGTTRSIYERQKNAKRARVRIPDGNPQSATNEAGNTKTEGRSNKGHDQFSALTATII